MTSEQKQLNTKNRYKSRPLMEEMTELTTKSLIQDISKEYTQFPKIKDIITENMKTDKLFIILQKLAEDAKKMSLIESNPAQNDQENIPKNIEVKLSEPKKEKNKIIQKSGNKKIDLFEKEDDSSLGSFEELDQNLKSIDTDSPIMSPKNVFRNPTLTLNDIINDSEFNQANLNNFPTNGLGNNIENIEKVKSDPNSPISSKKIRRTPRKKNRIEEKEEKKQESQKKFKKNKINNRVKFQDLMFPLVENEINVYPKKLDFGMRLYPKAIQNLEFRNNKRLSTLLQETGKKLNVFNGIHPKDVYICSGGDSSSQSPCASPNRFYGEKEDFRCILMQSGFIDGDDKNLEANSKIEKKVSSLADYNGNVLFMSILSGLAIEPSLIKRLVDVEVFNNFGVYSIWLNFEGFWRKVIVDDRMPYDEQGFVYSGVNPDTLSIWPLLIEKAYAKCYEGYNRIPIDKGLAFYLKDLTGAPVLAFPLDFRSQREDDEFNGYELNMNATQLAEAEEVWEILTDSFEKGYLSLACTEILKIENGNQRSSRNLLAFPVINCIDLSPPVGHLNTRPDRYIQLRQPFNFEKFPKTPKNIIQKLKNLGHEVNEEQYEKESLIWVPFHQFLKSFVELGIAMVNPGYVYSATPIKFEVKPTTEIESDHSLREMMMQSQVTGECITEQDFYESYRALVKLKIWEEGEYTISFNKPYKHKFLDKHPRCKDLELNYMSAMTMGKMQHDKMTFVDSKFDGYRNSVIHKKFEVGEYVILLDIRFTLDNQVTLTSLFGDPWKNCSLSCYGPKSCSMIELKQDYAGLEDMDLYYGYFEHKIWKDFINNPPRDINQYIGKTVTDGMKSVEMINKQVTSIHCRSLSVNHIIIEELKNDDPYKGLTFEKEINYCLGYEIVAPDGNTRPQNKYRIFINPGESEIVLLRFGRGREREFQSRMM